MKEKLINTIGEFTWDFGQNFFIETSIGNFVWSDPDYNGDNTIKKFNGTYKEWSKGIPFERSKGKHIIGSYVGTDFVYTE